MRLPRGHRDLDPRVGSSEFDDPHGCTGWTRVLEDRPVYCIHSLKRADVGKINLHSHDVIVRHTSGFQNDSGVIEAPFDLGLKVFRNRPRLGIAANLTRYIQGAVDQNSRTEWQARRSWLGKFRREDDLLFSPGRSRAQNP